MSIIIKPRKQAKTPYQVIKKRNLAKQKAAQEKAEREGLEYDESDTSDYTKVLIGVAVGFIVLVILAVVIF